MIIFVYASFIKRSKSKPGLIFCPSSSSRCWTALWTWWKRHGGQWACSDGARSQIARSSTTGGGVRASRRTHAKEAPAPLPSRRHTAPTLQRRVGTASFTSIMSVRRRNQQCCCHLCDWRLLFCTRGDCLTNTGMEPNQWKPAICCHTSPKMTNSSLTQTWRVLFSPSFKTSTP